MNIEIGGAKNPLLSQDFLLSVSTIPLPTSLGRHSANECFFFMDKGGTFKIRHKKRLPIYALMSSQVQKGGKRYATILFRNYHNTIFCTKKEISFVLISLRKRRFLYEWSTYRTRL